MTLTPRGRGEAGPRCHYATGSASGWMAACFPHPFTFLALPASCIYDASYCRIMSARSTRGFYPNNLVVSESLESAGWHYNSGAGWRVLMTPVEPGHTLENH